ncbi:type VII secretion target [Actinoplanes regularis]|uniref:Excreted virulence factor EspC, type VII ESX diderm n=1 Tax=Actinoplanes regularis TaxID=52697 RepID=A0A239IWU5_9ACTN|nr:type VII secretion target [Actinoplanes regularis]GIE91587.1 hypothetical protein Are01nite_80670 [Actinoplanes regularis]SNS97493.1 Excreted virulence factor EspC, type VII ESX diderm [Actinoplanes regularis]
MQPTQLEVDVQALRGIGTEVTAAATTLRNTAKNAEAGLAPTPQAGSEAARAAQSAAMAWLADLHRLTNDVDSFGARLTKAARDYRATDHTNADGLQGSQYRVPR